MAYKLPKNWSTQQQAVIDYAVSGKGNIVVEAVAGSGKTTLLMGVIVPCVKQGKSVCYMVFNKPNATEAQGKLADLGLGWPKVEACTVHSAGFKALKNTFGKFIKVNGDKVWNLVKVMYPDYAFANVVVKLVSFAKQEGFGIATPLDEVEAWHDLAIHHNMIDEEFQGEDVQTAIKRAIEVLQASNRITKEVDFDDMIYLCLLLEGCKFEQYDVVIVDEAQDTNICRTLIAKRMMKPDYKGRGRK